MNKLMQKSMKKKEKKKEERKRERYPILSNKRQSSKKERVMIKGVQIILELGKFKNSTHLNNHDQRV
jgi:hypothetical protein